MDYKKNMVSGMKILIAYLLLILVISCGKNQEIIVLHGQTMGTTYTIKIIPHNDQTINQQILQSEVDELLYKINMQMSTYIVDSEISKFNRSAIHIKTPVSESFIEVFNLSMQVYSESAGAFDPTVMPAVNLWGFGSKGRKNKPPSMEQIKTLKNYVGLNKVEIIDKTISKKAAGTELDFSAIAKGFGVDAVAKLISENGFDNFMVEIGGEVVTKGTKHDGSFWLIGIERPSVEPNIERQYEAKISLSDIAVATSGDYRNFFISEDSLYSHAIDPVTCRPIVNGVASVTVLAPSCALADAMATAIMVLGEAKGLEWVESKSGIETMIIVRFADRFRITMSSGFDSYLAKSN
jgi:thiamine biosynthesis lipoprotein